MSRKRSLWEALGRIWNLLKFEKEEIINRLEVFLDIWCCNAWSNAEYREYFDVFWV